MKPDRLPSEAQVSRLVTLSDANAQNKSGLQPVSTKVLILTDQVSEKSQGGIVLPPGKVEELMYAMTTGRLVAIGGGAFKDWLDAPENLPRVGDRVHLAKFAGVIVDGKDGNKYRLCHDIDIAGREIP